jgi:hypothetical protein
MFKLIACHGTGNVYLSSIQNETNWTKTYKRKFSIYDIGSNAGLPIVCQKKSYQICGKWDWKKKLEIN